MSSKNTNEVDSRSILHDSKFQQHEVDNVSRKIPDAIFTTVFIDTFF